MTDIIANIDLFGLHWLRFHRPAWNPATGLGDVCVTLEHDRGDIKSPLDQALRRTLRFVIDDAVCEPLRFPNKASWLEIPIRGRVLSVHIGSNTEPIIRYDFSNHRVDSRWRLGSLEARFLAEFGHPMLRPAHCFTSEPVSRTDLHTHFAGCIESKNLVALAIKHGIHYPAAQLASLGSSFSGEEVALDSLSPSIIQQLINRMSVPSERRITFSELEQIYALRRPLTKSRDLFIPLCQQIANDYAKMGADYVELSLSDIVDTDRIRLAHQHLPSIEAQTGVQIRFLGAMHRQDDYEWDLDYIEQIKRLVNSPYVVGVDFMGHETNSTRQIQRQIQNVAQWAHSQRPGFVIRVHAGENPGHPENVRIAMDCVKECDVVLRIGHGLYGVDEPTIERIKSINAIVEFNLNSNFVLNNIQSALEVPMERYLNAGVPVVLGTDGYGIYHTDLANETQSALLLGASPDNLLKIRGTELEYLARRAQSDALTNLQCPIPESSPHKHYTCDIVVRRQSARAQRDERLKSQLQSLSISPTYADEFIENAQGCKTICIAGAWRHSWENMPPSNQNIVCDFLRELLSQLDPSQFRLVTGGTKLGVEGQVALLANEYEIPHFGAIVSETPPDDIYDGLDGVVIVGENLWEKSLSLYRCMVACDALCMFIGGGNIVNDEIQVARNLRARYLLMANVEGASSIHARHLPDRAFHTAEEVLRVVMQEDAKAAPALYRHPGANPIVDLVLLRNDPTTRQLEILLIKRGIDAAVEARRWALPGGFQQTDAPRGTPWTPGRETSEAACLREAMEETGLDLRHLQPLLCYVGVYSGGGRDPRDTLQAWAASTVYLLQLPIELSHLPILGGDDASEARWFSVDHLPQKLAFDHATIIRDALKIVSKM